MLPKGWNTYQLSELMTFRNGLNYTQVDSGEEIKVVGVADFQARSEIEDTTSLRCIKVNGQVSNADLLESGDLLFVRSNGNKALIGRCLYFPKVEGRLSFSGFTIRGRVDSTKLNAEFAAHLMRSPKVAVQMHQGGTGTNISNLSQEILNGIRVEIPSLAEQARIAKALRTWEAAVSIAEKLLANCMEQKKALTVDLLLGRVRRIEHRTRSGRGNSPKDWRTVPLGEVAVEVSIKNSADDSLPVLSCTKHHGLVDSLSYFNKRVFSENTSTYKLVPRGAFAYATNHIDEGSIGYQDLYDKALISPMYTVFKTNEQMHHGFLYKLLKAEHYRQIFAANTNASVDRRGSLRWGDFKKIEIPLPSFQEQAAIHEVLSVADREVAQLMTQLDYLKRERRVLMTDLLTGKRRLSVAEAETSQELS